MSRNAVVPPCSAITFASKPCALTERRADQGATVALMATGREQTADSWLDGLLKPVS
jgi:hypothetical protein